jgi:hypothetical protein
MGAESPTLTWAGHHAYLFAKSLFAVLDGFRYSPGSVGSARRIGGSEQKKE